MSAAANNELNGVLSAEYESVVPHVVFSYLFVVLYPNNEQVLFPCYVGTPEGKRKLTKMKGRADEAGSRTGSAMLFLDTTRKYAHALQTEKKT